VVGAGQHEGRLERRADADGGLQRIGGVLEQHGELVAAEPGDGVPGAGGAGDPLRDAHGQPVAGGVAEAVVDRLEVVQVEEDDGHGPAVAGVQLEDVLEAVPEQRAVGQPGQRVGEGLAAQLLLACGEFADQVDVVAQRQVLPGEQAEDDPAHDQHLRPGQWPAEERDGGDDREDDEDGHVRQHRGRHGHLAGTPREPSGRRQGRCGRLAAEPGQADEQEPADPAEVDQPPS
jgi:hypothetical protein